MNPSVLIAVPAFGGNVGENCTVGLFNTAKKLTEIGIKHSLITIANESLISRGRSRLFNFFYNKTDFDYMLFLDADISFTPDDILKLLELNVDFSCAGVPLKSIEPKYNFGILKDSKNKLLWNANHTAFQVDFVGTAFMLLHRNVFTKMKESYKELQYFPSITHSNVPAGEKEFNNSFYFFKPEIINGDLRSEDYAFCYRWKKIHGDIWLRPDIQLKHAGSHIFTGVSLDQIFINM